MPLPFREPFFLRGRRSILQRAVILSLVLGGLSSAAGWIVVLSVCSTFWFPHTIRVLFGDFGGLTGVLGTVVGALLIHGPLNHWWRRSWLWTAVAIPLAFPLMLPAGIVIFGNESPMLSGKALAVARLQLVAAFAMIAAIQGVPRCSFRWGVCGVWLTSVLGSAIVGLIVVELAASGQLDGFEVRTRSDWGLLSAGLLSLLFAALSIPWGLPFWWPPQRTLDSPLSR